MAYVNFLILSPFPARCESIRRAITRLMANLQPPEALVHKPAFYSHSLLNHHKIFSEVVPRKIVWAVIDL